MKFFRMPWLAYFLSASVVLVGVGIIMGVLEPEGSAPMCQGYGFLMTGLIMMTIFYMAGKFDVKYEKIGRNNYSFSIFIFSVVISSFLLQLKIMALIGCDIRA